jgi:hypothetical protein
MFRQALLKSVEDLRGVTIVETGAFHHHVG